MQISAVFFRQSGGEAGVAGGKAVDFLSRAPRGLSVRHRAQLARQVRLRWKLVDVHARL